MENVVLLADDQMIVRKGLRALLERHFNINEIDEVSSCQQIMARLKIKKYSALITEISLEDENTSSIIPTIRTLYPFLPILIFTNLSEALLRKPLSNFGIHHLISKRSPEKQALKGLENFFQGDLKKRTLRQIDKANPLMDLAPREFEVYSLMLQEKSTGEIAKKLNIKLNTVSTIKHRIFQKNNVNNWEELKSLAGFNNIKSKKG